MAEKAFNSRGGSLWAQLSGPGTQPAFMGCHEMGDLVEPLGDVEFTRKFNPAGSGWIVVGEHATIPDDITTSIETLLFKQRDLLERARCPLGLYVFLSQCGRKDIWGSYLRGFILANARITQRTYSNLVSREEERDMTLGSELKVEALYPIVTLEAIRQTTAGATALNAINVNVDERCAQDCGADLEAGQEGAIATESAVGPATGDVLFTDDSGDAWAAGGTDPFAAGMDVRSVVQFYTGLNTKRTLVAMEPPAGAQGMVGYSDDDGTTWTTVNVGGAAAGHGAPYGYSLFALDKNHIWLAGAAGYIYFSDDGGETWTAQEAGVIHAGVYNAIHFADENYGVAAGAADIIATTSDGGETWTVATATGGGGDMFTAFRFDANRIQVGDDDGKLWESRDAGVTWTQITGWAGSGTGDVRGLSYANEYIGYMIHDTAGPVGTVLRTINGGHDWEAITTPTNVGLNHIQAVSGTLAYAVGKVQGGTGVILRVQAAGE